MMGVSDRYFHHPKYGVVDLLSLCTTLAVRTDIIKFSTSMPQSSAYNENWYKPIVPLALQLWIEYQQKYAYRVGYPSFNIFLYDYPADKLEEIRYIVKEALNNDNLVPLEMYLMAKEPA